MSNIAGKAYAMNVVTQSSPRSLFSLSRLKVQLRATWINRLIFMLSRGQPQTLGGLLGLSLIHFARWFFVRPDEWPVFDPALQDRKRLIRNDYMIFCSNFNGTWDQYIDAFSDGIPNGLDMFWYSANGYSSSIPITPFKQYITHNQIDTAYYYNATPGAAQRDVKAGLRVRRAILDLRKIYEAPGTDADAFARAYRETLLEIQGNLGDPGYGPVASLDTEVADRNRRDRVKQMAEKNTKENAANKDQMRQIDPLVAEQVTLLEEAVPAQGGN